MTDVRLARARITRLVAALTIALSTVALTPSPGAGFVNWRAYLFGPGHSSTNPRATAITPRNADNLVRAWRWTPPTIPGRGSGLHSSPTVFRGRVYLGSLNGVFYALDERTGRVLWRRDINPRGISSTATVALDPVTDRPRVYVAAGPRPDGAGIVLYALNANTGRIVWEAVAATQAGSYAWSSPTLAGGRIYLGVASKADAPQVRGGLAAFDQHTGSLVARYWAIPQGNLGATIWTSAAASRRGRQVWVTTGDDDEVTGVAGDSFSVVRLNGRTLVKQDKWTVSGLSGTDQDFTASPVLFDRTVNGSRTLMVGACNKNGRFYAWNRDRLSDGPIWSFPVGTRCFPAAVWDRVNRRLFVAGETTTIGGVSYPGSARRLDPDTGEVIWERGLSARVLGTPTLNGAGVLAVATWDQANLEANGVFLLGARTGRVRASIRTNSAVFAQPVFADRYVFVATLSQGLLAFRPRQ